MTVNGDKSPQSPASRLRSKAGLFRFGHANKIGIIRWMEIVGFSKALKDNCRPQNDP
jgi:hypothetical protein